MPGGWRAGELWFWREMQKRAVCSRRPLPWGDNQNPPPPPPPTQADVFPPYCVVPYRLPAVSKIMAARGHDPSVPAKVWITLSVHVPDEPNDSSTPPPQPPPKQMPALPPPQLLHPYTFPTPPT